jgi:hypothetical protein
MKLQEDFQSEPHFFKKKIGSIKNTKSTVRNQSIIQKSFSSFTASKMVLDERPTGF